MSKPATQIKSIIESHLRGSLFGMNIWGRHEIPTHDTITVIEVRAASRFERYGTATVYHPTLGKWICSLSTSDRLNAGAFVRGTPKQVLTAEEIKVHLAEQRSLMEVLYRVYDVPMPEVKPVAWDPYWEGAA